MKRIIIAATSLVALALPGLVYAQGAPMVTGTVKKVDQSAEKITLEHGKIPNLGMDVMTMVFKAKDKSMLRTVKPGDTVKFAAERVNGQITVTAIEKAK